MRKKWNEKEQRLGWNREGREGGENKKGGGRARKLGLKGLSRSIASQGTAVSSRVSLMT